ncbi:UDP-N-acetylmuramoyl-L-alanyl-D-glutamate--2,6-diaminopimelate ligase [Nonomuraea sp. NPDC050786]|uniref:UDP-N-acetylmuramoyl-L-alanyl-D-glutamate--2, 6-diaminopimelate ligase n=1 Tax=Nonomuraea sp. NPDC050786 TaxID=3154840 RepID=UPI00340AAFA5
MNLRDLLVGYKCQVLHGDPGQADVCAGIAYDSRRMTTGCLYIAMRGSRTDGHRFVADAVEHGAAGVLVEHPPEVQILPRTCVVQVADTRAAAAVVAARYFGEPSREMRVVAVTGTNGKTSVSFMTEAVLRMGARARVGVIGTDGCRIGTERIMIDTTTPTTPEAVDLQCILRTMRDRGAGSVVLEASSMALALHRVDATDIDVGVFTNLTPDHLDNHGGSMEAYKQAKLLLFGGMCQRAVVNADDQVSADIAVLMPGAVTTYGLDDTVAEFRATDLRVQAAGTRFVLHHAGRRRAARVPIPGRFAVSNALATLATGHLLGYDVDALIAALEDLPAAPGRFQTYQTPGGVSVVVDYAHSVDSLEKVLATIRAFAGRRVFTVFGCGGDRDPSKRAPMGKIAGTYSDVVVVTSDNPRGEDPDEIIDAIMPGLKGTTAAVVERITDRRQAIARALEAAEPGDVVLVAGKGAEPYQIVGGRKLPFDDMAIVQELSTLPTA